RRAGGPSYAVGPAVLRARDGRLLLVRRPEDGLLGGMWSFPGEVAREGESVEDAAARAGRAASGLRTVRRGRPVGSVVHVFSHRREVYHVFVFAVPVAGAEGAAQRGAWVAPEERGERVARGERGGRRPARCREARGVWVAPEELGRYALPSAQRRILGLVEEGEGGWWGRARGGVRGLVVLRAGMVQG